MTSVISTTSQAAAPTLKAASLGGQRGNRPLFRGLELTLLPGQVIWLRGRNGRGKTSLLRLLAGVATAAQGRVLVDDQPLRQLPASWRTRLLYIAHANALKDDLSAAESLRFLGRLQGREPSGGDIASALARLGVGGLAQALVRTLSQGQRRRVALARLALAQPPSIWLLDEPYDALDDEGVHTLNGLLTEQAHRGGSVMLTSHQPISLGDPEPHTVNLDDFALAG